MEVRGTSSTSQEKQKTKAGWPCHIPVIAGRSVQALRRPEGSGQRETGEIMEGFYCKRVQV